MKKRKWYLVIAVMLVFVLAAMPVSAKKRDTMVIAFPDKFPTLDNYQSSSRMSIQMGYMVFDALVTRDPDTGRINPGLARSWKNIDPVTWEFKIQPNVKFHNGNPCNAEAIRFTIEDRILDKDQKATQYGNYKWIKKVEVIDDVTFRIITHKPYPLVLERLNTLFVYDPVYCKEVGDAKIGEAPMGSGPYIFVKWDRGNEIVLKKNPNYWQKGIPKIDNVICRIIPEMSTAVAELISGGVHFIMNLSPDMWGALEKAKNVVPMDVPLLRVVFWQFDSSGRAGKTPVMDKRVRQAIIHAIDRKTILKTIMGGFADGITGPLNPLHWGYDPEIEKYDYVYDPEKAKTLLKEAGYENGFSINLSHARNYMKQTNQAAIGYLEKVGIKVNLKEYIGIVGQYYTLMRAGKISGIGNYSWGSYNVFDADALLSAYFLMADSKCYTKDQKLNDWLQEARESVDPKVRQELYSKAQKHILGEAYWMPFFIIHGIMGRHKDLNIIAGRDEVPRFSEAYWNE